MKPRFFAVLITLLCGAGALAALQRQERFPHAEHARLFPLCTGCHEGVPEGDRNRFYPARTVCAGCHNGTEQKQVSWTGRRDPFVSNLKFSHPQHEAKEQMECGSCHTRSGTPRMTVERALPDRCFACHTHRATNHFVDARCEQCHVPLARTTFVAARVEALPKPPSHSEPDFLTRIHGELSKTDRTRCEVCHTRERCASCHVDAQQRAEVQALDTAGAGLQLPKMAARYAVPASHRQPEWIQKHGASATQNPASCSTCHTRESCATCHASNAPAAIRALPSGGAVTAPGVTATRRAPPTHNTPFFAQEHGTLAAASSQTCLGCHTRPQCEDCHNSARAGRAGMSTPARASAVHASAALTKSSVVQTQDTTPRKRAAVRQRAAYHPVNFQERHSAAAYNRNLECSNCHDTARFCRACHEQRGTGTTGRLQPGFHDAQPLWLLNHGKPARQGMESCASCHKQTDCMQCHSGLGSFRVSPHGPGFDAARVQKKNARLCSACHLSDPLQRTTP
jgi:hypothetical protein